MINLPRGVRIDHGYVQVRLESKGKRYCKNFGIDCKEARELAIIHLSDKRKEILLGKFGYAIELPSRTFLDVTHIFIERWAGERAADGLIKHTTKAIYNARNVLDNSLVPFFGRMPFDSIRPVDVQRWRDGRLQTILGTSANREQAVLSSIFSHVEMWVKSEQIKAFKLPAENPCTHIKFAPTRKRERVLSTQELQLLKAACWQLNDAPLWDICKMALKSLLRTKDLMRLESGESIDIVPAKTAAHNVRVQIPLAVLKPLDYVNFRKRWEAARKASALADVQFRDLRKTGAHLLKGKNYSQKLIGEVLGHRHGRTTDTYMVKDTTHLEKPLNDLSEIVEGL